MFALFCFFKELCPSSPGQSVAQGSPRKRGRGTRMVPWKIAEIQGVFGAMNTTLFRAQTIHVRAGLNALKVPTIAIDPISTKLRCICTTQLTIRALNGFRLELWSTDAGRKKPHQQKYWQQLQRIHLFPLLDFDPVGYMIRARCLKHLTKRSPRPTDSRLFYATNLCRV
jgi:hypothetical protein